MAGVNHTREKGPSHRKTFPGGVPSTYSGPTAARPGAGEVDPGTLYLDTDTNDISRSDGHSWDGGFGGGSTALNDLTDVTIAAVATGDYLRKSAGDWVNVTVSQLLTDLKTVDGAGSGLDADLLDGLSSADFLLSSATSTQDGHFGDIYLKDDTNPSHYLKITVAEDLTGAKTLSVVTGDANRTLTFTADASIGGANTGDQTITLTGDVTGSGTTTFAATIANDAVTYAKLQNVAGYSIVGKATTGAGDASDITAADETVLGRTGGGNVAFAALATGQIANDAVTYAKIQNISATQRVLGRNTAGAGDTEEVTASQVLDWRTTTRGSLLYRGASTWDGLAPGTSGYPLLSSGAGADPAYGQADHGAALTGLGDDDHTQYLLLAGRAGGQVAKGGTAASEVLDLYGTAHATLGAVRVKDHLGFTLISPSQITSNQNNYAPGISTVLRLSSDASRDITGIVAPVPASCASIVCLINVGSNNIVLKNQDANSTAANRFLMEDGADLTLTADDFCWAVYDYTTTRWRVEKKGSGGGATNALLDGANHTDTVAQAVTRGSIIYGDSTPKWNELVLGTVGQVLMSDGTDLYYQLNREAQHVYLALATEVTNTAGSATTTANLIQAGSDVDATSYATAAVTFSAAKLAIITVFSVVGSGTVNQATATQAGASPRTLTAIGYKTTGQIGMTMFRCMASTASSNGAVTFDFNGQTQLRAVWVIDEITNADPAGNADNGASCINHQTPVTNSGTGTTASVTLSAFEGDGAGAYGAFGNNENRTFTASNGYAAAGGATAETLAVLRGVFDGSAPAVAPSATLTSATWVGIGVEIRRDPGWYTTAEHPWLYEADNFPTGMKAYPEGFMRTAGGATDQAVIQFYQLNATAAYVVESVLTGTQVTAGNFNSPLTNRARYTTGIAKASLTDGYTYCVRAGGLGDAQIGIKGLRHYIF